MIIAGALWIALETAAVQDADLQGRIDALAAKMSDESKETRDKALNDLVKIGRPALETLKKLSMSTDAELKGLATQGIDRIEWGVGLEKLKQHVKERYEEGATVEPSKLKVLSRWFPAVQFHEVNHAAAGRAAGMAGGGLRSVFALQKYEDGYVRLMVKGVPSTAAITALIKKQKIVLDDYDTALDFAMAFIELYTSGFANMGWNIGATLRFDKSEEGWELQSQNYGISFLFKTDKSGTLIEVTQPYNRYMQQWQTGEAQKLAAEKAKLEMEKLRIELELLKRQLEEAKKGK